MSRSRVRWVTGLAVALALLAAGGAFATSVQIGTVSLNGGDMSTWDPANDYKADCTKNEDDLGFAPVSDGTKNSLDDAFDGGLMLLVGNSPFHDGDENADKEGETLSAGPDKTGGLKVSANVAAIQTSPTLRALYELKNGTNKPISRRLVMASSMGSDGDTVLETTSSGDQPFTAKDRWVVSSDNFVEPDPVVTNVLYGKGKSLKVSKVLARPGEGCPLGAAPHPDAVVVEFEGKIPAHSTRYMMFFAEMNDSVDGAGNSAMLRFDEPGLDPQLLGGLSSKVKKRILNWDL